MTSFPEPILFPVDLSLDNRTGRVMERMPKFQAGKASGLKKKTASFFMNMI
ncbi:hypothetical protein GHT06_018192 [Daphnia sinensis]|uniref:Uncharacterized protein n=1 Tax=Daphnia sinensis TaxID=1820382 RepID=A0AAD5PQM9_9CRUS|nr:hypothetical protein GHT06_018192 [Daphnia sinensis]